jgi:hypothetical protein
MKKLLLLIISFISGFGIVKGQQKFDLQLWKVAIMPQSNPYKNNQDTVEIKSNISIELLFYNNGTVTGSHIAFPGGKYGFNYYVSQVADWPAKGVSYTDTIDISGPIPYGKTEYLYKTLYINPKYFKGDDNNIIIIWPNGGKAYNKSDSIDTTTHFPLFMYVLGKNSGIDGIKTSNFSIYPNPVKDVLNIRMNEASKGVIRLTDMSGKLVAVKPFEVYAGGQVMLPINDGAVLPDGVYFISIETADYKQVSKIIISK